MPKTAGSQGAEFVGVVCYAKHYIAVHVQETQKRFVSKHPEIDIRIAQTTAIQFAASHDIPYSMTLLEADRPIISVVKEGDQWFPATINATSIKMLTAFGPLPLGGTQEQAINMAKAIAISQQTDFLPQIGITMCAE